MKDSKNRQTTNISLTRSLNFKVTFVHVHLSSFDSSLDIIGTLDEKEKVVMNLREKNNAAQKQFAQGYQLTIPIKKEYAQNMVELSQVNSSIGLAPSNKDFLWRLSLESLFAMISKYSSGLSQRYPFELDNADNALSNATDLVEHEIKRIQAIQGESEPQVTSKFVNSQILFDFLKYKISSFKIFEFEKKI